MLTGLLGWNEQLCNTDLLSNKLAKNDRSNESIKISSDPFSFPDVDEDDPDVDDFSSFSSDSYSSRRSSPSSPNLQCVSFSFQNNTNKKTKTSFPKFAPLGQNVRLANEGQGTIRGLTTNFSNLKFVEPILNENIASSPSEYLSSANRPEFSYELQPNHQIIMEGSIDDQILQTEESKTPTSFPKFPTIFNFEKKSSKNKLAFDEYQTVPHPSDVIDAPFFHTEDNFDQYTKTSQNQPVESMKSRRYSDPFPLSKRSINEKSTNGRKYGSNILIHRHINPNTGAPYSIIVTKTPEQQFEPDDDFSDSELELSFDEFDLDMEDCNPANDDFSENLYINNFNSPTVMVNTFEANRQNLNEEEISPFGMQFIEEDGNQNSEEGAIRFIYENSENGQNPFAHFHDAVSNISMMATTEKEIKNNGKITNLTQVYSPSSLPVTAASDKTFNTFSHQHKPIPQQLIQPLVYDFSILHKKTSPKSVDKDDSFSSKRTSTDSLEETKL